MAKKPNKLINESKKVIRDIMQQHLVVISADLIAKIMRGYRTAPNHNKFTAINNVDPLSGQLYRNELREAFSVIAREAIEMAKKEVPSRIKFGEYEKLPPNIRKYLDSQSSLFVGQQISDLKNKLFFEFSNNIRITDSDKLIESNLAQSSETFITGPAIAGGSSKIATDLVTESRNAYFFQDDVLEEIEGFKYVNEVPVSAICKELNGMIFSKNDPDYQRYQPPLHFNCDGYYVPILRGDKETKDISKFTPSKKAQSSIQFAECSCGGHEHDVHLKTLPSACMIENARKALAHFKLNENNHDLYLIAKKIVSGGELPLEMISRIANIGNLFDHYS